MLKLCETLKILAHQRCKQNVWLCETTCMCLNPICPFIIFEISMTTNVACCLSSWYQWSVGGNDSFLTRKRDTNVLNQHISLTTGGWRIHWNMVAFLLTEIKFDCWNRDFMRTKVCYKEYVIRHFMVLRPQYLPKCVNVVERVPWKSRNAISWNPSIKRLTNELKLKNIAAKFIKWGVYTEVKTKLPLA